MGKRYGKLPSELFVTADSFDLMVMDCAISWERYVHSKENNNIDTSVMNTEDMQERLRRVQNAGKN